MRLHHERLRVGDRVDLPRHDARGVVVEVLGRETVRVFRDGSLEVHEVSRYCVRLTCGRSVVVNDGGGRIVRAVAPQPRGVESPRGGPPPAAGPGVAGRTASSRSVDGVRMP